MYSIYVYIYKYVYVCFYVTNSSFKRHCRKVLQFLKGRRNKFFQEYTVFPPTIAETNPCIN